MNTKRLLISILVLFAGLFSQARTQTTSAIPTDFAVLESAATSTGILASVSPYLMADNRVPDTRLPVQVVNAWSTNASADSAWAYTKKMRREWIVNLTSWTAADSTFLFTIKEYQSATGALITTYTQFVNYGTVKKQGANWYKGAAHNEANFGSTPLGINLSLANYATMLGAVGWNWHLYLVDQVRTKANTAGTLAIYQKSAWDTLTVLTNDTLRGKKDTTYTAAFAGGHTATITFIDANVANGNTAAHTGRGIQIKLRGVNAWTSPALQTAKKYWVIDDSLSWITGDSLVARLDSLPPLGPEDSVRQVYWGKSNVGRTILRWVKILFRD